MDYYVVYHVPALLEMAVKKWLAAGKNILIIRMPVGNWINVKTLVPIIIIFSKKNIGYWQSGCMGTLRLPFDIFIERSQERSLYWEKIERSQCLFY